MKTRSFLYAFLTLGVAACVSSCRDDNTGPVTTGEEVALSFLPSIGKTGEETVSLRSGGGLFFKDGDTIAVKIKTNRAGSVVRKYTYIYGDGTFNGDFRFTPDNTYIVSLEALWPDEDSPGRAKIITDQRKYENYKQTTRLKAVGDIVGIMPTAEPVPLVFEHEQSSLTFRLAGQNANGLSIKSLILELEVDSGGGEAGKAFWAYCGDNGALNAKMVLPAGVKLGPGIAGAGRTRIGMVTAGEEGSAAKDYRGVIYIADSMNITLESNHDYLVTLTPEGYDMYATVSVSGFPQSEGHVAVPFQLPVMNGGTGKWEITTVAQLVTVSWLLYRDMNGELQSDWVRAAFDITQPVAVSDKVRAEGERYLKADVLKASAAQFSGRENASYSDGTGVFD